MMTPPPNGSMMEAYLAANPNSVFARYMGGNVSPVQRRPTEPNMQAGITSFAAGGMVTADGGAIRPGAGMQTAIPADEPQMGASAATIMAPGQVEQEARQLIQKNPQIMQHVMQLVGAAIQDGSITPDELNMMVQLAKTAIANPKAYPQIRQFAIQNGLGTEADIPQEFDPGLVYVLMVIGQSMQGQGQGGASTGAAPVQGDAVQGQRPGGIIPEYSDGGPTGDKKHLAMVHPREYIIPEDALMYHGKKTFDNLIKQAREPKDGTAPQ